MLAIRARLHLESGRPGDACEDGLRLVRFGRRIQSSQGTLVVHMRGIHVESLGNVSLVYTAIRGELPIEACRRGIEVLNERLATARWLQDSLAAEYVGLSETIDYMAEGKIVEGLSSRVFRSRSSSPTRPSASLARTSGSSFLRRACRIVRERLSIPRSTR